MINYTEISGMSAAIITGGSMVPQLIKTIKCREAEGISISIIAVLMAGLVLWTLFIFFFSKRLFDIFWNKI